MDDLIAASADKLFAEATPPDTVRRLHEARVAAAAWAAVEESGFLDALVPEAAGGAGLSLSDMLPVLLAAGRHGVPLPVGATMTARALLAEAGLPAPRGAVALASGANLSDGRLVADVPAGEFAAAVLVQQAAETLLLDAAAAERAPSGEGAFCRMGWAGGEGILAHLPAVDAAALGARIEAAEMAGAVEAVFAATLGYANERSQFGRPIGKFQAIQQQLAVMTELVHAARASAELAFAADADLAAREDERIAAAKIRVGEAAAEVTRIAHAVHGAIGMTEELNLHLLTERLRRGRLRYGSERYWARRLGRAVLAARQGSLLDVVRLRIAR